MGQTPSKAEQPAPIAASSAAKCPIDHSVAATTTPKPAQCPIEHSPPPVKEAQCPIDHGSVNPSNQMPTLSQDKAHDQTIALPTERTESSIPRDHGSKWEYPSPQQFYNALVRKGWETPEEHIETMVHIHNFLNEEAWEEVKKWESRHSAYVVPRLPITNLFFLISIYAT